MGGFVLLVLLQSLVLERFVAEIAPQKLLTDRTWFSQVANVPVVVDALACMAVSDPLHPGVAVEGYELVERLGLLGVCKHQQTPQMQWPVPDRNMVQIIPCTLLSSNVDRRHLTVCPLPGAAKASQQFSAPPLPLPELVKKDADIRIPPNSPEGPMLEYHYATEEAERIYVNAHYRLKKKFDAGSHGEVWRATRSQGKKDEQFVLKRLYLELGENMVQMGLREAHFGALLQNELHVSRFVEYFFRPAKAVEKLENTMPLTSTPELWLVFRDEGKSLRQYLYEKLEVLSGADGEGHSGAGVVLQPSRFWEKLRTDVWGESVLREIMRQLLVGVASLHARGITHRDIKPSNILVFIPPSLSSSTTNPPMPLVKLADFGSAVDDYTLKNLYRMKAASTPSVGPSQAEETREYQPPEVLFSETGQPYDYTAPEAYDLWSVGVVFLEIVLGSPHVFLISPRERAKMDVVLNAQQRLRRKRQSNEAGWRTKAYLLHVLTHDFCIFQPGPQQLRSLFDTYALVSESCHFGRFNRTVIERDPLKKGLQDMWGLDLIWRLLQWHPKDRITAIKALEHAFFQGAYVCNDSGRQFATKDELLLHERYLKVQKARDSIFASVVRPRYELPDRFTCPHCGRIFSTAHSCELHAHARRHMTNSSFCTFEASKITTAIRSETKAIDLPKPRHSRVSMALFQGRKKYMEDFVLVVTEDELFEKYGASCEGSKPLGFHLFAVVDGHLGVTAATFVVENLPRVLFRLFAALANTNESSTRVYSSESFTVHNGSVERKVAETFALRQTFLELQEGFLLSSSNDELDLKEKVIEGEYFSGCTLTVVLYFYQEQRVVSANVGDSRALAIFPTVSAPSATFPRNVVPLSKDHCPNDSHERFRIESSGGFVTFSGLWRVVGQLAVSRSLGDRHLQQFVTAEPSVFHEQLPSNGTLVIASDGLWESMSNDDVVRFLIEKRHDAFDDVAINLLVEGYVRGSLDNMAVVLVALT
ncbi:hypothetical protein CCR75_007167 [Bremia lactucae]|uniref:Protein kinase n=1 Tax=Bremia lactucae TaxID=4779 RepID=A0A976IG46_BRELC|nr:hypothetical protein CCR75_007167 [Bremia lactucae]